MVKIMLPPTLTLPHTNPHVMHAPQRIFCLIHNWSTVFRAIDPGQKSCNENIDVSDLLLDGARIAHGCLLINSTMGGNVGPDVYSVNFMKAGISVSGGPAVPCDSDIETKK